MTTAPPCKTTPGNELSKAYAIVYNAFRGRFVGESFVFSASCISDRGLLILYAELLSRALAYSLSAAASLTSVELSVKIAGRRTQDFRELNMNGLVI
jgi:hypothetical protein